MMKKQVKRLACSILIMLFAAGFALAQEGSSGSIIGQWKTIDDETNEPKSIVQIYEKNGKFFGEIKELFRKPGEEPDPVCDACDEDDPRYNQKITGMVIIQDLEKDGDEYSGGTILDPNNGEVYTCKLWIEDGSLMVRGYVAFFFRTQTWHRVK